jgi:hypothetical protein
MRAILRGALPAPQGEARVAWLWLARLVQRLNSFADRLHAGALKPPHARTDTGPQTNTRTARQAPHARPKRQPRGWLAHLFQAPESPVDAIATLMANHDIKRLLAQEPSRFSRLLNPLCRALGLPKPTPLNTPAPPPPQTTPTPHPPPTRAITFILAPSPGFHSTLKIG